MNSYLNLYFICVLLIVPLWFDLKFKYSYSEVKRKLENIHVIYNIQDYTSKAILYSLIILAIVYGTIQDAVYTTFLIALLILFLPYLNYIHLVGLAHEHLNQQIYDYLNSALTYLKEDKTVNRILVECSEIIDSPFKDEILSVIERLKKGVEIDKALVFNYSHEELQKLNQLMISKSKEGISSSIQVQLLLNYVENKQKANQEFHMNMDVKRKGFYMVIGFSLFSAYITKELFQTTITSDIDTMKSIYFIFYLFHGICILLFEKSYSKKRG